MLSEKYRFIYACKIILISPTNSTRKIKKVAVNSIFENIEKIKINNDKQNQNV